MKAAYSLRRQMATACALVALVAALCFSAFGVIFVYVIEDSFINNMLEQEAALVRGGRAPLLPFVTVHDSAASFPADLEKSVDSGEFFGRDGRHYHVRQIETQGGAQRYLVAEVSSQLVVRPQIGFIMRFLGTATLLLLAITGAVGYWLARRASKPLLGLTALVSGAEPGQLPQGFSHQFPDNEIGALARTLDQAMARLDGFIAREQHFTRDASHELRTPLTVIDGAAQLLAGQQLSAQAAEQVQRIRQACAHMRQCVDTLLALAREDLAASDTQPVDLLPLAERIVLDHAHLLQNKEVEVLVEVAPHAQLHSRGASVAILLANLVSNAFVHTAAGTVRIAFADGELVVEDSGPGMAPELGARACEAGVKGAHSPGTGLGLSIASRLAARSGMRLAITPAQGGGTRASLRSA